MKQFLLYNFFLNIISYLINLFILFYFVCIILENLRSNEKGMKLPEL
jgi:hypothetical protein